MYFHINHTGSPSQARACLILVEQLGSHLKELKTLENAGSMDEARSVLSKLLVSTPRGGVNRCTANLMNKMWNLKTNLQHT